ncbi:MAG: hypothetical protein JRF65_00490 [Deltaproteobacteria bacterium]|nr:hypothetical protein [Deltaproteobacteria bacterium]
MTQLAIYIDARIAERLDLAAKEGFFDLAGSWRDDSGPAGIMARIRKGMEAPELREDLFQ